MENEASYFLRDSVCLEDLFFLWKLAINWVCIGTISKCSTWIGCPLGCNSITVILSQSYFFTNICNKHARQGAFNFGCYVAPVRLKCHDSSSLTTSSPSLTWWQQFFIKRNKEWSTFYLHYTNKWMVRGWITDVHEVLYWLSWKSLRIS